MIVPSLIRGLSLCLFLSSAVANSQFVAIYALNRHLSAETKQRARSIVWREEIQLFEIFFASARVSLPPGDRCV